MNNSKFGKPDVAKLYRRFTRSRAAAAPLPEVEALLALADGQQSDETERLLADVARSGMHADLLRFTRALAPESARLGAQLDRALERPAQSDGAEFDFFAKSPGKTPDSYTVDHTAGTYLFDPSGRVRLFERYGSGPEALTSDVKALLSAG